MANPQDLIAQLMMAQQQGGAPGSAGMPMPPGGPTPMPPVGVPPVAPPMPMPPGGPPPPGTMPQSLPPDAPEGEPSDEDMLNEVSGQMGGGTPPPIGGMKWQNLAQDQQALQADPSPENVQAFVEYWGEDKLPPGIQAGGDSEPDSTDRGEADENE